MDLAFLKDLGTVVVFAYGGYKFVRSWTEESLKSYISAQVGVIITPVKTDIEKIVKEVDALRAQVAIAYSAISDLKNVEIAKGDSIREASDRMAISIQRTEEFIKAVKKLTGDTEWVHENQVVHGHDQDALPNPDTLPERKKPKS